MSSEKNSKKNGIEKLRILLDKKSLKKLDPEDEKYLIALKKRLDTPSSSKIVIKKIVETPQTDESYLKPKVIIHTRKQEIKPISKIIVEEKPEQQETEPIFKEVTETKKIDDDLIEIKKVEVKQPEFLEVKPKTAKKEENITTIKETKNEEESESLEHEINNEEIEELTEWEPVIDKKEQVVEKESSEPKEEIFTEIKDKQIEIENLCPKCGNKTKKDSNFCQSCGSKLNQDFEEKKQNPNTEESVPCFIPVEKPDEDIDWKQEGAQHSLIESETKEIISVEPTNEEEVLDFKDSKIEKIVETDLEKEKKKEAFKEIENIDEETAVLLYDNGYTTIDSLKNTTIQDLKKIKGIKKKKAKKIIFEIENKFKETEPDKTITEENDTEYFQEDTENQETTQDEIKEEQIQETNENTTPDEEKITAFNEITNIDEKTAILLYDHGFTSIELLKNTTLDELIKIPGIKKKKAKKIISEIEEKILESTDPEPITVEETADGELTQEQINDEKIIFEEEKDDDYKVELHSKKAKWTPIEEDQDFKEEKTLDEEPIEENKEIEKIEIFAEIKNIDEETAVLLYDNGYTTIDSLKNTTIQDLKKIKGIKKKKAKDIIFEIESIFKEKESEKPLAEEYDAEYFQEHTENQETTQDEIKEEQIQETNENTTPDEEKIAAFNEITNIDEKTAILLYDHGFTSIDALGASSVKDIAKISGIKKRKAKQIKKELEEKIIQSAEPKPINVDEIAQGEITEEQQEDHKVEFELSKSEWTPTQEEQEIKEEPVDEEPILEEDIKEETVESEEIQLEQEKKKEAFKEIKSIDDKTAITLYDNGFTSIDSINIASLKDITKTTGIKKRKAKQIKKEVDEKTNEIFGYKPIETQETAQVEVTEEQIQELDEEIEEDVILDEEKIAVFNEIKIIDKETAIKLYNNGYNTIDILKNATIDDLVKIAGIKKRKAKQIIYEIEEKIIQSAEPKPIKVDETAQGEITEEQIKNKTVFEEEQQEDHKVEFELSKSEWTPVQEEQEFKEEKITPQEEKPSDEDFISEEDIKKIEVFAEIESIDAETAILLYNNGFTSFDLLKKVTLKDIKKIKGIKKKKAKDIIFEIESRFKETEPDKPITEEYDAEYFEEEFDEDLKKVDEQIKKFEDPEIQEDKEDTEFFEDEIEDVPEIQPDEKDESVFREIESIDNKISALLIKNGIDNIEKLNGAPIKELIKIKGIRKKTAKQIKKEVEMNIKINRSEDEKSYDNIKENPYIKNEDDQIEEEWESIDNKKTSKKQRTIYGFMYNEYTLYEKEIITKSGSKRMVRFFSKGEPEDAKPIDIPEGYEVDENKSGVPYLRKIKD